MKTKIEKFLAETVLASESMAVEYLEFYSGDLELALSNYHKDFEPR